MTIEVRTEPAVEARPKTVPEVLRHAALVIEERGHHKGGYVGADGSVCAWGAINVAVFGSPRPASYTSDVPPALLRLAQFTGMDNIGGWSDSHSAAEVTAAMRAAAATYDE